MPGSHPDRVKKMTQPRPSVALILILPLTLADMHPDDVAVMAAEQKAAEVGSRAMPRRKAPMRPREGLPA